jgi:hypothetical protein
MYRLRSCFFKTSTLKGWCPNFKFFSVPPLSPLSLCGECRQTLTTETQRIRRLHRVFQIRSLPIKRPCLTRAECAL